MVEKNLYNQESWCTIWKSGKDGEIEDILHFLYTPSWVKHDAYIAVVRIRIAQSQVSSQRPKNESQQDRKLVECLEFSPNGGGITGRRCRRRRMYYQGSNGAYCFQRFMSVSIRFYLAYQSHPQTTASCAQ